MRAFSSYGSKILDFAPGLFFGLFCGRVLSELWANYVGSTELWFAGAVTLLSVLTCSVWLRRYPLHRTWPALFLLFYIFYPEFNLQIAGLTALFVFLLWWQSAARRFPHQIVPYLVPVLLLAAAFVLYLATLAPDLLPADSGEFQLVAANLGVAHPPGFPLYTMLAHLMTRLPLGPSPAFRTNLFSAVTSTLTLATVYIAIFTITRRTLAAAGATLLLATATTFWSQATTTNIRSMTALFAGIIFLALVLFYDACQRTEGEGRCVGADRYLLFYALALGLGISHHASLVFLLPITLVFLLLVDPGLWRTPSRWWRPGLAFLLGLLPLLYLPLRAQAEVRGADPSLATLPGFLQHALALGFRGDLFSFLDPALLVARGKIMINVLTFQFSALLLVFLIVALILLLGQDWRLALLFGGSALLFTFISATYRAPQTVEYMLPAYVALVLLLGSAIGGPMHRSAESFTRLSNITSVLLAAGILILAVLQLYSRYDSYAKLAANSTAREYAEPLLDAAPPGALLLANWHWVTPLWYLQEVEGTRPDVEVRYVFPEGESYNQTWARRVDEGVSSGRDVIVTNFDSDAYAAFAVPEPIAEAFLFRQSPRELLPAGYTGTDIVLGDTLKLHGFQVVSQTISLDSYLDLHVAWQASEALAPRTTLFAHLVDKNGRLVGQADVPARAAEEGLTITRLQIYPFVGTPPGEYQLLIGAYADEPITATSGETRVPLSTFQLTPAVFPAATKHSLGRKLLGNDQHKLVGFDWDSTVEPQPRLYLHWQKPAGFSSEVFDQGPPVLPAYAGPWGIASRRWSSVIEPKSGYYVPFGEGIVWIGDRLEATDNFSPGLDMVLEQTFLSGQPVLGDLVLSVRLVGYEDDGYHWAWWDLNDSIPAMGAIPSLKWIDGSQVTSPHFLTISSAAQPDQQIGGILTVYDAFTNRILPILDDRLVGEFGWVPLGEATITAE